MLRVILFVLLSLLSEATTLYIYNWSEYTPRDILDQFTAETGIEVRLSTYDSNEVLYTKVKILNSGGFDLIFPSTYFVEKMANEDMLYELNKDLLPNLKHMNPRLMDRAYDRGNRFSVPYLWGNTAILFREKSGLRTPTSFSDFWKPEYKGKILLLNDMREVFAMSLRSLGYSANSTSRAEVKKAYNHLKKLMPSVRIFNSDSPRQAFLTGEVGVGMSYNGGAYRATLADDSIRYIYPEEGATLWVDSMAIPRNATHPKEAHQLINFLMRPDIAAQVSARLGYSSPNEAAVQNLESSIRQNPVVYPEDSDLDRMEVLEEIGRSVFHYEYFWERLKVQ